VLYIDCFMPLLLSHIGMSGRCRALSFGGHLGYTNFEPSEEGKIEIILEGRGR